MLPTDLAALPTDIVAYSMCLAALSTDLAIQSADLAGVTTGFAILPMDFARVTADFAAPPTDIVCGVLKKVDRFLVNSDSSLQYTLLFLIVLYRDYCNPV